MRPGRDGYKDTRAFSGLIESGSFPNRVALGCKLSAGGEDQCMQAISVDLRRNLGETAERDTETAGPDFLEQPPLGSAVGLAGGVAETDITSDVAMTVTFQDLAHGTTDP